MLIPILAHVNVFGEAVKLAIPQASVEPPSISAPVIVRFPEASSAKTVAGAIHTAVGATLSSTVTVALHVEALPLLSVTVNVTVLEPTFAHVNAV